MGDLFAALFRCGGVISLVGAGGKTTFLFRLARGLSRTGDPVLATSTTKLCVRSRERSPVCLLANGASDAIRQWQSLSPVPAFATAVQCISADGKKLIGFSPEIIDRIAATGPFRWILVEADGAARRPLKAPAPHEPVVPAASRAVVALVGLDAIGKPLHEDHVFRAGIYARLTGLNRGDPVDAASVAAVLRHPEGLFRGSPATAGRIVLLNKAETPFRRAAGRAIADRLANAGPSQGYRVFMGSMAQAPVEMTSLAGEDENG